MTTNGSATATVETLAAEVHVLKVGNRQITLSAVKQLDRIGLNELEPFGRIRTGRDIWFSDPEYCERPVIELIGRHTETGALARSCALVPRADRLARAPTSPAASIRCSTPSHWTTTSVCMRNCR